MTQPHSVPLQALAGGGIVGLLLLLTAGAAAAVGVTRSLQRLDGPERAAAAALAVFPLVWALHALVDYDVEFVAVTAPMLIAVGALLAAGRPPRRRPRWLAVAAAGAAALAVIGSVGSPALAARGVERAYELIDAGRRVGGGRARAASRGARPALAAAGLGACPGSGAPRRGGGARAVRAGRGAPAGERGRVARARALPARRAPRLVRRLPGPQPRVHARPEEPPLDAGRPRSTSPATRSTRVPASAAVAIPALSEESRPICGPPVDNEVLHSPSRLKSWAVDNASEVGRGRPRQGADVSRASGAGRSSRRR